MHFFLGWCSHLPLARLGYKDYTVVDDTFSLSRPDD